MLKNISGFIFFSTLILSLALWFCCRWDGLVVWICGAYAFVTLTTVGMFTHTKMKEKSKRAARRAARRIEEHAAQSDVS